MLQRAMELAESLETAAKMHGNSDVQGLHKKRSTLPKFTQWALSNLLQIWPKSSILCYCCRKKGHTAAKCCFKDARCHHCGKVGHSRGEKLLHMSVISRLLTCCVGVWGVMFWMSTFLSHVRHFVSEGHCIIGACDISIVGLSYKKWRYDWLVGYWVAHCLVYNCLEVVPPMQTLHISLEMTLKGHGRGDFEGCVMRIP